jgi:hypothetical protein
MFDDYLWATGVLERKVVSGEEVGLTDTQAEQFVSTLLGCRCVVLIEDQMLVSMFKMEQAIRQLEPRWDSSYERTPKHMLNDACHKFFNFARTKLHPELLYSLSEEIKAIDKGEREPAVDGVNPSSAT